MNLLIIGGCCGFNDNCGKVAFSLSLFLYIDLLIYCFIQTELINKNNSAKCQWCWWLIGIDSDVFHFVCASQPAATIRLFQIISYRVSWWLLCTSPDDIFHSVFATQSAGSLAWFTNIFLSQSRTLIHIVDWFDFLFISVGIETILPCYVTCQYVIAQLHSPC